MHCLVSRVGIRIWTFLYVSSTFFVIEPDTQLDPDDKLKLQTSQVSFLLLAETCALSLLIVYVPSTVLIRHALVTIWYMSCKYFAFSIGIGFIGKSLKLQLNQDRVISIAKSSSRTLGHVFRGQESTQQCEFCSGSHRHSRRMDTGNVCALLQI